MQKKLFIALMAAGVLTLGLAACSSNEDNPSGTPVAPEAPETDRVLVTEWNAPNYFQHAIATCDHNGENFESFNWGVELYKDTDPGHLYIGVDTWDEAEKIFRHWMAPNVELKKLPPSVLALLGELPDMKGIPQLDVFLKPGETDDVVAEVTVSDESKIKHFNKITFLKNSAWPQASQTRGSDQSWNVGDIVKNVKITSENSVEDKLDSDDKKLDFVCIRASGNGINPWFVTVTNHDSYKCGGKGLCPTYDRIRKTYWTPDYDTTVEIQDMMKENWDIIKSAWSSSSNIGNFPNSTDNKEPYIDRCHLNSVDMHYYDTYNFETSYINGRGVGAGCPFFLNFNNYGASDVYDGCTVWRGARSEVTTSGDHLADDCP